MKMFGLVLGYDAGGDSLGVSEHPARAGASDVRRARRYTIFIWNFPKINTRCLSNIQ
jgi:hypothetical protein